MFSFIKLTLRASVVLFPVPVFAATESQELSVSIDAIWVAISIALVFFMQAGFAFLECGFSRTKNAINVIMKNYTDMCVGGLVFWAVGFGLMFGETSQGYVGTSAFLPQELSNSETLNLLYQLMFAATAATIFSGAVAERMRFWSYLVCGILVTGIIYPVFGHWAWSPDGWLNRMGFIDFAGGTVVHSVGGWCALAGIMILGPRLGRFSPEGKPRNIPGHSLPFIALGGFILWLGWFGFNGGSIAGTSDKLGLVLLNTHLSGCAGVVGALLYMGLTGKRIYMTTTVNGGIGGLVAVTAGALTMDPVYAMLSGFIGGILTVWSANVLQSMKLDDVVGAVAAHGICGAWGTVAAGLFFSGDLFSVSRVYVQLIGVGSAFLWTFCASCFFFYLVDTFFHLRAESLHEQRGLDFTEHHELGYAEFQQAIVGSNVED